MNWKKVREKVRQTDSTGMKIINIVRGGTENNGKKKMDRNEGTGRIRERERERLRGRGMERGGQGKRRGGRKYIHTYILLPRLYIIFRDSIASASAWWWWRLTM